jgi:release factor glutamine methyltransferase
MNDRILEHKPLLAYERKKAIFLNREFYIDNRVYVPNPETELMVEYAIKYISENNLENGTFIDVGTGCGNIAISLAKAFPNAQIIASDISEDALEVAKENVIRHQVQNIHFNTDLVKDIDVEPDLIIGNLPWGDDDHLLQTNTKEDLALMPPIAIFAPDGIIGSYVRLCEQIRVKKWNTVLIAEVGLLEKEIIENNLPKGYDWEYITLPSEIFNYSILKVKFKAENKNQIIHHHLIYQARVDRKDLNEKSSIQLVQFLNDLVSVIDMQILIPPQVAFSHQKAWTGLVGIVTSHISFHFWTIEGYLQLDIYSCKRFDIPKTVTFLDNFWKSENKKVLFIERAVDSDFKLTKY